MKIVLVETFYSGHHLTYLEKIASILNKLNHSVELILPTLANADIDMLGDISDNKKNRIHYFNDFPRQKKRGRLEDSKYILEKWKFISLQLDRISDGDKKIDLIFFPYLDNFLGPFIPLRKLNSLFRYRWSGLYMAPQNGRIRWKYSGMRKGILSPNYLLTSRNCIGVAVLDAGAGELLKNEIKKTVVILPDIVDDSEPDASYDQLSMIKKKANGKKIVTLIGSLDKRKGVLNLLEAAVSLKAHNLFFLFAGKLNNSSFSTDEMEFIHSKKMEIESYSHFMLERIPDENKFNALIAISDILVAAYIDFAPSSNIIGKAALFKKPVIVSKGYCMEEMVDKYQLGECIQQNNSDELKAAIQSAATEEYATYYHKHNKAEQYSRDHSPEKFVEQLALLLRSNQ